MIVLTFQEWKLARLALSHAPDRLPGGKMARAILAHAHKRLDGQYAAQFDSDSFVAVGVALRAFARTPNPHARAALALSMSKFARPTQLRPAVQKAKDEARPIPDTPMDTFQAQVLGLCAEFILQSLPMWPDSYRAEVQIAADTLGHVFNSGVPDDPQRIAQRLSAAPLAALRHAASLIQAPLTQGGDDQIQQSIVGALDALNTYLEARSMREAN